MKYFLDTEFAEKPGTIELISVGIVSEKGKEYYAVSDEFSEDQCNEWVKQNVLSALATFDRKSISQIRRIEGRFEKEKESK